jgi:peptidoglycan hydrolase-like protein with peptidoglycan-binding domain
MPPTLQQGDGNEWVEYVQLLLGRADHETGRIDAGFGPITEAAVRRYGSDHRLEPGDGIVDDLFWQSSESSVGARRGCEIRPRSTPTPTT